MNPPKMPIHIGDYLRDTRHLRAAEHGAYLMLLFHYWSTGGLPDDDRQLAAIACMTPREWHKARPTIQPFFQHGWKHKRVDFDLQKAAEKSAQAANAGTKSAQTKAQRKVNERSTDVAIPLAVPLNETSTSFLPLEEERKKDAADAALPERQLFDRGKQILGQSAGGLIAKLLKHKKKNVALARAALEMASTKQDPREYINSILVGGEPSGEGHRLSADEQYWGKGRIPGIT